MRQTIRLILMLVALSVISGVMAEAQPAYPLAFFMFRQDDVLRVVQVDPQTGDRVEREYPGLYPSYLDSRAVGCYLAVYQANELLSFLDLRTGRIQPAVTTNYVHPYAQTSPDEHYRWFVYARKMGDPAKRVIFDLRTGARVTQSMTIGRYLTAQWSPDSRYLLENTRFIGVNETFHDLPGVLVNPATGQTIHLPDGIRVENPWSPDGRRVIRRSVTGQMTVVDVDGLVQVHQMLFKDVRDMHWLDRDTLLVTGRDKRDYNDNKTPLRVVAWSLADNIVREYAPPVPPDRASLLLPDWTRLYHMVEYKMVVDTRDGQRTVMDFSVGSSTHRSYAFWSGDGHYMLAVDPNGFVMIVDTFTGQSRGYAMFVEYTWTALNVEKSAYGYFGQNETLGMFRLTDAGVIHDKIREPGAFAGQWCMPGETS